MKAYSLFLLCFLTLSTIYGQHSNKVWTFGENAGLDFNQLTGGYPTAFAGSQLNGAEGIACISSDTGNLLFYTDGTKLYDYNHNLLASSLYGDTCSTQSAIIVPNPGLINNSRDYYIFTVDNFGGSSWTNPAGTGIYYSIVNVNFNNPITVSMVQSNIPLAPSISFRENLMAVCKKDSPGYWVISRQYAVNNTTGSDAFYVWDVGFSGVNTTPQIYNVGSMQNVGGSLPGNLYWNGSIGYLKISPDGTVLAMANNYFNNIELYRFNPVTGVVLPFSGTGNTILPNLTRAYGVEFSPNNQLLYVSRVYNGTVYQYDLTSANIASTQVALTPTITGTEYIKGAIQLGPDNKIYICKFNSNKLAVINEPNLIGNACNLTTNAVTLAPNTYGKLGLPTFVPTRFVYVNSINNLDFDKIITVYPNPCSDILNIDYPGDINIIADIKSIDGKTLLSAELNEFQRKIDIKNLPDAVYFIKLSVLNKDNRLIKTLNKKIVKIS